MSSLSIYPPETNAGTLTSWIPVGTTFPSPSGCESLYWSVVVGCLAVWDPGYGIFVDTRIKCLPPAATTWWDQDRLGVDSATVVSLGPITCPSDYTTVTTMIQNQFSTFVACCPTNYTFFQTKDQGTPGECSSVVPAGRVITYALQDQKLSWTTTSTSYTTDTQAWGIQINGYNIAPQTTFSSTASTSATSSTVGTPQPSSGLSTGAKAGIGFGVAFWALALGALIVLLFTQRQRKRIIDGGGPASNLKSKITGSVAIHERIDELDGREMPAELDSTY